MLALNAVGTVMDVTSTANNIKQGNEANKGLQKEIATQKADFSTQLKNQAVMGQQKINQTAQAWKAKTGAINNIMK